jgi:capsule polysaccharide modification protein KpsS
LNVPTDSQILVRASYFRDFISLISLIADSIPFNHYLIIREHPSFPGMLDYKELKRLLRKKENIKLVSHRESFFDLVKKSKSVLIINNTSYLESIILGKPVLALGIGPFTSQNILHEITNFRKLGDTLNTYNSKTNINQLKKFLNNWYLETFPLIDSNLANSKRKIDLTLDGIFEKISLHLSFSLTKTIDDL